MLCYVMLCYAKLCYAMLCCYVMLRYSMLCYVMLCYVMLCYVMLCYVMLCYVMLCYVMLCYVMLCYVMLCYVINVLPYIPVTWQILMSAILSLEQMTVRPMPLVPTGAVTIHVNVLKALKETPSKAARVSIREVTV